MKSDSQTFGASLTPVGSGVTSLRSTRVYGDIAIQQATSQSSTSIAVGSTE